MSKKNKGHDKPSTSTESGTSVTSASKPRALRKPRGTLLEQFANKADKVYSMVSEISKELTTRGAPKETCRQRRRSWCRWKDGVKRSSG